MSDQPAEIAQPCSCGLHAADVCHHCGRGPDPDGDHSCPCPFSDSECLEHTLHPVTRPNPPASTSDGSER